VGSCDFGSRLLKRVLPGWEKCWEKYGRLDWFRSNTYGWIELFGTLFNGLG